MNIFAVEQRALSKRQISFNTHWSFLVFLQQMSDVQLSRNTNNLAANQMLSDSQDGGCRLIRCEQQFVKDCKWNYFYIHELL